MTAETIEQVMDRVASAVANRYAARCWWADRTDLRQQAYAVVLEVRAFYAPRHQDGSINVGLFGGTAYVAAMRQLSRYLWRQSAPVSAEDKGCRNLAGVHHIPVRGACHDPGAGSELPRGIDVRDRARPADEALAEAEILFKIKSRMRELCGCNPWVEAAMRVLLDYAESPAEVAREEGLPVFGLYRAVAWVKAVAKEDPVMRRLAAELVETRS